MDTSKVRLNSQGRVRPRKYDSKYTKLKRQRCDNEVDDAAERKCDISESQEVPKCDYEQRQQCDNNEEGLQCNNNEQHSCENSERQHQSCDNNKQTHHSCDNNEQSTSNQSDNINNEQKNQCDNNEHQQQSDNDEQRHQSDNDQSDNYEQRNQSDNDEQRHQSDNDEQYDKGDNNEQHIEMKTCYDDQCSEESLPHNNLFDFMKQRDESVLEELMSKIREENDWDPCDVDSFDEIDENISTDTDNEIDEDSPVQPGHSMSLKTAVLVIWLFAITHSLTSCQLSDLLTLINLFMLNDNPVFKTLYRFKKVFQNFRSQFVKHYYCNFCHTPVGEDLPVCPNGTCLKDLSCKGSKDYFLELPISLQLEHLFSRSDFRDGLKHRKERIKRNTENIEDVYDSELYKDLSSSGGPLSEQFENNISFTLNTDGVPIFKSSKFSIWPIFLMVNELPFRMRKNQNNMLLCGLWYGQSKPLVNLFCRPLHQALTELEKGINISVKPGDLEETISVRGFLFCLSCDTPARSMMLNMNQHNGEFACPKCLQQGCNHRTSAGGNIRIFPYDTEGPTLPERSHQQCLNDAQQSMVTNTTVNGIKGPSFLMFCQPFDCVKNVGIDYMHLLCLGIVRMLMKLWFSAPHRLEAFSLYRMMDVVDARLTAIRPPHFISRTPRGIGEHVKFWKASELRSWLFFYSVPCITDLLKPKFLYHYCCLVEGIFLLNQRSISMSDIENSQRLLNYFVFMFPVLYGERYLTINMHSLVHLPKTVQQLGPLWCVSCFAFESANGELLKLFHGTQYIDIQILNAVHIHQLLPSLVGATGMATESPVMYFIKSLFKQKAPISGSNSVYGRGHVLNLTPELRVLVCAYLERPAVNITYHAKAHIRGTLYFSKQYSSATLRNSYTVKFINNRGLIDFGCIHWFAVFDSSSTTPDPEKNHFCCISVLKEQPITFGNRNINDNLEEEPDQLIESNFLNLGLKFLHVVKPSDEFVILPLNSVVEMCVCIIVDGYVFICEEPNHQELNL